jgi:hypothetical protein
MCILGRVRAGATLSLLLIATTASADKWEQVVDWQRRSYAVHGVGEIEVRAAQARVKILPGQDGRIIVSGTLRTVARDQESAKNLSRQSNIIAMQEGERVIVDAVSHGNTSIEVVVEVPQRAIVRVRNAGHVDAPKLNGPLDVQIKSGSLSVGLAAPATVHAETAKGRIDQDIGLMVTGKGRALVADGRYGNGGPTVNLLTGAGNITIHPSK